MELWQALALAEYRYAHPSADSLVAGYLGYRAPRAPDLHPELTDEERLRWARSGVRFSQSAPPIDKLPPILKNKFPFLVKPNV